MTDYFADALTHVDQIRDLYDQPSEMARKKAIGHLDERSREFVAASGLVFLASVDGDGHCDVTPRGGPAGFVSVLDDRHLAIPDATGNKRLDTMHNVVVTGRLGLVFLIVGRGQTLRVNGRACVTANPELVESLTPVGKPPRSALVVQVEEVYAHCPKAFVRSGAWKPETWPSATAGPDAAELVHAHLGVEGLTVDQVRQDQRDSLRYRLD